MNAALAYAPSAAGASPPMVQPVGVVQHVFAWFYVCGVVEPTTGARFFLELPSLNAESSQIFVKAFAEAFPDSLNLAAPGHSGAHTAQRLTLPVHVCLVFFIGERRVVCPQIYCTDRDDLRLLAGFGGVVPPADLEVSSVEDETEKLTPEEPGRFETRLLVPYPT